MQWRKWVSLLICRKVGKFISAVERKWVRLLISGKVRVLNIFLDGPVELYSRVVVRNTIHFIFACVLDDVCGLPSSPSTATVEVVRTDACDQVFLIVSVH